MTSSDHSVEIFTAGEPDTGKRLDLFLREVTDGTSRSRLKALIKESRVALLGATITDPSYRVKPGDAFTIDMPLPEPPEPQGENIPLDVIYEDDQLIVINKPAGLVVHPAAGNWTGTLVNALLYHCGDSLSGIGGVRRPGIVQRLDKQTSGLMVVAKTDHAHIGLSQQFANHGRDGKLTRAYLAICWGVPFHRKGVINAPLARSTKNRLKQAVAKPDRPGARQAITHYQVLKTFGAEEKPAVSLVRCVLETGRTHQIRVHMDHIGHPVLGDKLYGRDQISRINTLPQPAQRRLKSLNRHALHAAELGFIHPKTGKTLEFQSPMPDILDELIAEI